MKLSFIKMPAILLLLASLACFCQRACGQDSPDRVILFVIDGLAVGAPDRIEMPAYNALKKEGVYYREMHLILAGHPEKSDEYPWSCSIPNPMLMSGTPFIGRDGIRESLIQHSFQSEETAFIANAQGYLDVSGGFGTYVGKPRNPDSLVIDETIEKMKEQNFPFMRVHLQRAGIEGMKVSKEKYSDKPYYRNIWHKKSRYRKAVVLADKELGRLVAWLKSEKLWDGTLLLICGDHGQANEGWHEPYSAGSNVTPLLVVGAGVKKPASYDYCEIIDLAPTIAHLLKKEPPALSQGRVLREAFQADPEAPKVARCVKRLNKVLIQAHGLPEEKKQALTAGGFLTLDELGKWHTTDAGTDFEKFTSQQEAHLEALLESAK